MRFIMSHDMPSGGVAHNSYNSSILISFHIKGLTARLKLYIIMMNEGSLDRCTFSYPFLACAGSSCFSTQQAMLE